MCHGCLLADWLLRLRQRWRAVRSPPSTPLPHTKTHIQTDICTYTNMHTYTHTHTLALQHSLWLFLSVQRKAYCLSAKTTTPPYTCAATFVFNSAPHRQHAWLSVETACACTCVAIQLIFSNTSYYGLIQTWYAGSYGFYKNIPKASSLCQLPDILLAIVFLVS